MKQILSLLAVLLISTSALFGNDAEKKQSVNSNAKDTCIEVLNFHSKQRCVTCRAIESLTKEVVSAYFAKEQKEGKVIYRDIDISQKENEKIAEKYEVTWSSLILDKGGIVVNLTEMGFSYAKGQPEVFKSKLKEEILKLLK